MVDTKFHQWRKSETKSHNAQICNYNKRKPRFVVQINAKETERETSVTRMRRFAPIFIGEKNKMFSWGTIGLP